MQREANITTSILHFLSAFLKFKIESSVRLGTVYITDYRILYVNNATPRLGAFVFMVSMIGRVRHFKYRKNNDRT